MLDELPAGENGSGDARFRFAEAADAAGIAALHADSWRRHYRGAYSDSFLDGDVIADRHAVWSARLAEQAAPVEPIEPVEPVEPVVPVERGRASRCGRASRSVAADRGALGVGVILRGLGRPRVSAQREVTADAGTLGDNGSR
ncbi:hypothetical protein AB0F72_32800 [Actinoplanes sp. NPDC023936]|uniref:hypothetical protein n=1 Tax=Actinoplanes sp. NPDC023936 TaxID=3154910 RepID=UPI00340115F5